MTKLIMTTLSMIFLSSCQAPQFKPEILCDISFVKNRCRCRCVDINSSIKTINPKNCEKDPLYFDNGKDSWNLKIMGSKRTGPFLKKSC